MKEPARICERRLKDGNVSMYLDMYCMDARKEERLKSTSYRKWMPPQNAGRALHYDFRGSLPAIEEIEKEFEQSGDWAIT